MNAQDRPVLPRADFLRRVISAVILLPFVLAAFWAGGVGLGLLVGLFAVLMVAEWTALMAAKNPHLTKGLLIAGLLSTIALTIFAGIYVGAMAFLACLLLALLAAAICKEHMQVLVGGFLYIAIPVFALLFLRAAQNGALVLIYLAVTVWVVDICALLVGKSVGGAKLLPRISPQKTWAGLGGAIIGGGLTGILFATCIKWAHANTLLDGDIAQGVLHDIAQSVLLALQNLPQDVESIRLAMLGGVLAVIAQAGDLFESWLKRRHNVKHSGTLLPGHGGILDRVDGLVAVLTIAALVLFLYNMRFGGMHFDATHFDAAILLLWPM